MGELVIDNDTVVRNGIEYKKNALAGKVVEILTPETEMHPEFTDKFLRRLETKFQVANG